MERIELIAPYTANTNNSPRVINVDQNRAYPPAVEELKEEGVLSVAAQLGQCKYLNTARRTIGGYEAMNMIRKGQVEGIGKGDIRGQVRFVADLFEVAV